MAEADKSKQGKDRQDLPAEGGANQSQSSPDAKKARPTNLDTQSLKALAPDNEVARSALEMRQNLDKFVPPGPQRDQLIAQLKEDVTPLLGPELEAKQAQMQQSSQQALSEKDQQLNEAIDRAARQIKDKLGQFESFGPVKEVLSVSTAVIDHLRLVLHDPRRDKGEFQIAVGIKDHKHFSSSRYFEPSPVETFAYERQTREGLSDLQVSGYAVEALIHCRQCGEGKDATHFANADIEQADALQMLNPGLPVRTYLLTPAPENILIVYSPNYKEKLPLGEAVGFFAENGDFEVRNDKYITAFEHCNLVVG